MPRSSKKSLSVPSETRALDQPFDSIRRSMDEMMGRMFREWPALEPFHGAPPAMPSMDVAESETAYEIKVDLPGMDEKDVKVTLDRDTLTIAAEHTEQKESKEKTYHVSERRRGAVRRSLRLPQNVDPSGIEARFDKGVLTVELPKGKSPESARTIAIKKA